MILFLPFVSIHASKLQNNIQHRCYHDKCERQQSHCNGKKNSKKKTFIFRIYSYIKKSFRNEKIRDGVEKVNKSGICSLGWKSMCIHMTYIAFHSYEFVTYLFFPF